MKTKDLRRLIVEKLNEVDGMTYYQSAPTSACLPYKVYSLQSIRFMDSVRDDYSLIVSVWHRIGKQQDLDDLADEIEKKFNSALLPQSTILPVFFREGRNNIEENDKNLLRVDIEFSVQNYERG